MILKNPDNTETYYQTLGNRSAKTLVLLHGIGADCGMWQPQMKKYANRGYHLLVPDLFGHGRSSKLSHITLSDWHNQINWLLERHDIKKCTLIGVSMGGVITQSFVVNYLDKVEKAIVVDSFSELKTYKEKLLGFSAVVGFNLFKFLGKKFLSKGMELNYSQSYAQPARDYFQKVSLNLDLNQMILARKAINKIDDLEKLKSITLPTLVIVGAQLGQWFIEVNRKIANSLPNSQFVILENSIDPSNLVNPVEFDRYVLEFLQRESLDSPT
ncbi:alpha/beta hydrolase [Oscillatoriales cyanobacterium LEGE 11467]|uniref:Alpha/beta hydrolase n=1 Tax=Zarconia navalis LEGE 11467 TaxID=1828826 RepID=A0A928VYR6_9CYAN|nr:alpha/beta hydrolase [Zarconia navalis]MBE9040756.1 alpha/beta hydrolase [Zarconia navalis LEGE 11467]